MGNDLQLKRYGYSARKRVATQVQMLKNENKYQALDPKVLTGILKHGIRTNSIRKLQISNFHPSAQPRPAGDPTPTRSRSSPFLPPTTSNVCPALLTHYAYPCIFSVSLQLACIIFSKPSLTTWPLQQHTGRALGRPPKTDGNAPSVSLHSDL